MTALLNRAQEQSGAILNRAREQAAGGTNDLG
jgi:hypothetical protein